MTEEFPERQLAVARFFRITETAAVPSSWRACEHPAPQNVTAHVILKPLLTSGIPGDSRRITRRKTSQICWSKTRAGVLQVDSSVHRCCRSAHHHLSRSPLYYRRRRTRTGSTDRGTFARSGEKMHVLVIAAQLVVALSVAFVWVVRFPNVVKEFHQYGLSDLVRSAVGATKIALATLLVAGIWFPALVVIPALLMVLLMVCAQLAHAKAHHPWQKYVSSLLLLVLSLLVAGMHGRSLHA